MNSKLPLVICILVGVLVIEIGALSVVFMKRDTERELARISNQEQRDKAEAERRAEERSRAEPTRVLLSKTRHECSAMNGDVTCHLTNFDGPTIVTCMQGLLVQKEATGVRLLSMPMCSGPIRAHETRSVSAPWDGGRASDICKSERGHLDFEKCNFTVLDYEPKPVAAARP